jgi:hypothetical protein
MSQPATGRAGPGVRLAPCSEGSTKPRCSRPDRCAPVPPRLRRRARPRGPQSTPVRQQRARRRERRVDLERQPGTGLRERAAIRDRLFGDFPQVARDLA